MDSAMMLHYVAECAAMFGPLFVERCQHLQATGSGSTAHAPQGKHRRVGITRSWCAATRGLRLGAQESTAGDSCGRLAWAVWDVSFDTPELSLLSVQFPLAAYSVARRW
mmetsp:Transcript_86374/g.143692  ORF Transcript_86374/g.143692 Transcript_86374/m.143692 type:complete len:109 (+) Transcript_86374:938-1264(+)